MTEEKGTKLMATMIIVVFFCLITLGVKLIVNKKKGEKIDTGMHQILRFYEGAVLGALVYCILIE